MNKLIRAAASFIIHLEKRVKSNPHFTGIYKSLSLDTANSETFANPFQHDKMLADKVRLDSYQRAITKYVKEGDTVIDLGTGSGILSFIASSRRPKKIYAIDHSNIIEKAKLVSQRNGITNIEFLRTHSRSFRTPEKADIIIQEQIGEFLFNEDMVACVADLRDRLLKEGGKIIPNKFELFIEPAKLKDEYHVPFIWEQHIHNVDYASLRSLLNGKADRYYYYNFIKPYHLEQFLCDPEAVVSFDLETIKESDLPNTIRYLRTVRRDGRLDGFCLYFKAIFDDEIFFSNSPMSKNTSWAIPLLRVESRECKRGDVVEFGLTIDDIRDPGTWSWSHNVGLRPESRSSARESPPG